MAEIILRTEAGSIERQGLRTRLRRLDRIVDWLALPAHRPFFVAVSGACYARAEWSSCLVKGGDIVEIVFVLEGGGAGSSSRSTGKNIGAALGLLALSITAPFVAGGLAGALGLGGSALATGVIGTLYIAGGGLVINQLTAAKSSAATQDQGTREYGVSGGGNLPRPLDPIPVPYGTVWHTPDLAQRDFVEYDGAAVVLYKRLVVGPGSFDKHAIRVGNTIVWDEVNGVSSAFPGVDVEWIEPGAASNLVPLNILTSAEVSGATLPADTQAFVGPFAVSGPGVHVSTIMLDFSFPSGAYMTDGQGRLRNYDTRLNAEFRSIDDTGQPLGNWQTFLDETFSFATSSPQHITRRVGVSPGRFEVRFRRLTPLPQSGAGEVSWDQLRASLPDTVTRPGLTELALRIRSGSGLSQTSFSAVEVRVSKRIRAWTGQAWTAPLASSNPAWIVADMLTDGDYGVGLSNARLDLAGFLTFADLWAQRGDQFNSIVRGPVSALEAAQKVLMAGRAQPLLAGALWSIVRDEAKTAPKFIFSGRSIKRGTSRVEFVMSPADNVGNVSLQFFNDADPNQPAEVAVTLGDPSKKPRQLSIEGITSHEHAWREAVTFATADLYRRQTATFTVAYDGRMIARGDPCRVELPIDPAATVRAIIARNGYSLTLDAPLDVAPFQTATLRDRRGVEWGPVGVSAGPSAAEITLNQDDVAYIAGLTSLGLDDVVVVDDGNLPAILFGTLEPFVVVAARPLSLTEVEITAINDPDAVHAADGSPVPPPVIPPSRAGIPTTLEIGSFAANASLQGKSVAVEWAFAPVAGAARYWVEISYDEGETRQTIGDSPNPSGNAIIRPSDAVIYARAVSAFGIASQTATVVVLAGRFAQEIQAIDPASLSWEAVDTAFGRIIDVSSIRRQSGKLQDALANLADFANSTVQDHTDRLVSGALSSEQTRRSTALADETQAVRDDLNILSAAVNDNTSGLPATFAKITEEAAARVTATDALAERSLALESTVNDPTTGLSATRAAFSAEIDTLSTDSAAVASVANSLSAEIAGARNGEMSLSARFNAVVTAQVNGDAALAGSVQTLSVTTSFGTASGQVGWAAESGPGGVGSYWRLRLSAGAVMSGLRVGVNSSGVSEVVIDAGSLRSGGTLNGSPLWELTASGSPTLRLSSGGAIEIYD